MASRKTVRRRAIERAASSYPFPQDRPWRDAYDFVIDEIHGAVEGYHEYAVNEWGGLGGVRSSDALMAAIHRPFTHVNGEPAFPTGLEQAAILFASLCTYHAFTDANKRTAVLMCCGFLKVCGYWVGKIYLTDREANTLSDLAVRLAASKGQRQDPEEIEALAIELHGILAPTKRRFPTLQQLRDGRYHSLLHIFDQIKW